jgi:hypothetical protein
MPTLLETILLFLALFALGLIVGGALWRRR